jgi:translation initiation factor IF-2
LQFASNGDRALSCLSVQVIETAAPVGLGLVELEEALLFQAELMELKASKTRPVVGAVVEARMDKGQGAVATVLVKRGTLKVCLPPSPPHHDHNQ